MGKRNKYRIRKDGRRETTRVYDGVEKPVHFYGKTDEEIDRKIAEYERSLLSTESKTRLFETVADEYMEEQEKKLSPNSICGYRTAKNRAVAEFGDLHVDEITPQMVIKYLQKFAAKDLSQKVISNSKIVLKGILDVSFIAGEIDRNPCADIPVIKGKPKEKRHAASEEDIELIEKTKTENLFAVMSYFMEYTGCRRGEAAALQQKNVDRINKKARICQTVAYADTRKPIIKPPKTEAGYRDVDLYDNVLEILPEYDDPETYIFFPDGLPTKTQLESGLKEYQTSHGMKSTAHQLRHTYASMLHSAGVDVKDAQTLLGHSSIAMTQDVYTELEKEHKDSVRESINKYIKENRKSSKKSSESR